MNGIRKQPVGPANRVAADDPFHMPVITGNVSVREEPTQIFLLVEGIKSQPYGLTTGSAGGLDEPLRGIFRYRL